ENLSQELTKGVKELDYITPTTFQTDVFNCFKQGKNIVGTSDSNYGKTLAFCLPILAKVSSQIKELQAIIVTESVLQSELCLKECRALSRYLGLNVANTLKSNDVAQIVILPAEELFHSDISSFVAEQKTIFFDGLSKENAERA